MTSPFLLLASLLATVQPTTPPDDPLALAHDAMDAAERLLSEARQAVRARVVIDGRVDAGRLDADLQYGRIDEILATGLHAYLTQFLERVNALGVGISRDFLVPVAA